jgi:general secretion pathway protein G
MISRLKRISRAKRGFTLIELLVVLVILALLAGIVLPRFLTRGESAKQDAARSQIATFKTALNIYALDNGQPPTTSQGLDALVAEPTSSPRPRKWQGPYLADVSEVPLDPWGNEYDYRSPGPNGEDFYIVSYGADGREGGTGNDEDIDSTQTSR